MRTKLQELDRSRLCFTAIVKRYGGKLTDIPKLNIYSWRETLLVVDVKNAETLELMCDHLWFKVGKRLTTLNAQTGDTISFHARIDSYFKKAGEDYHLENPTRLAIVNSNHNLFPDETARTVGSGIEYAQKLKEQYDYERRLAAIASNWNDKNLYDNRDDDFE